MNVSAIRALRQKLAAKKAAVGLWVTLESPSITEMAVAAGLDWVVIDAEHGHLDWNDIIGHVRATVRSDTVALVRITKSDIGLVKRTLDIGADGVVVPWIETAEQLREVVGFARYPPRGIRGIGGDRATAWGQCIADHVQEANEHTLVIPMIESPRGGANIREMLEVDGVEIFFMGPADYSSSAGFAGQWEGPGIAEELIRVKNEIVAAGKHCGVITLNETDILQRREQGFHMLGIGSDCGLLIRAMRSMLTPVGRSSAINTRFAPYSEKWPLHCPPESFRPDRPEAMNDIGQGAKREIQPGIVFECLVGAHNGARNLTTGIVTVSPASQLAYHTHPTTESITLLSGEAAVEVEGRRYQLTPLDNVTVPPGVAHSVMNLSTSGDARFHIAFPTDAPARNLVESTFTTQKMPDESTGPGTPGVERVNRFRSAPRFEAGSGATFIDFFNAELMPWVEMSGGYGVFAPGGRLPAHIHDFDESICIVDGTATCVVEGRLYSMQDYSTALQPRGRVHYFVNDTREPMAMIWVYAGPDPQRIVVDEHNATEEGNPWR
jgi:2-dehydro-3-deoxyglucarate aldolase/4-hydroxy-2-oxoheptanedioate aldolase